MEKQKELQRILLKIPKGKVTTYKTIAKRLGVHPRYAGRLLGMNPCPRKYPCYKVVGSDGRLCGYLGGIQKKAQLLRNDGIEVKNGRVDLKRHLFKF